MRVARRLSAVISAIGLLKLVRSANANPVPESLDWIHNVMATG
ncbi:hypothetical protein [Plantactinospora sp. WMMB782]